MKTINVEIEGLTPLLMHNPASMLNPKAETSSSTQKYDTKEEAEKSAYRLPNGELFVPSMALFRAIIGGTAFKKAGKYSAKGVLSGNIRIEPFQIPLGTKKYEIDLQTVVIQRARIVRARARVDKWKLNFKILYNEQIIGSPDIIRTCLKDAGSRIGILDYRPAKGGYFGTFKINKFTEAKK
jgi:hypothetical protein